MDTPSLESSPTSEDAALAENDIRPVGVFPPPRKLTADQERELTYLYAETTTPIADIAQTFSISEVSVGRIAQRNGAASRRRRAAARDTTPGAPASASGARRGRRRRADAEGGSGTGASSRGQAGSASADAADARGLPAAPEAASPVAGGGARRHFRIRFFAETVVEANDLRDALVQAEALGATDVTGIVQENG